MGKKNATSPIWQYFGFTPDEKGEPADVTQAVCKLCSKVVPVKESQTTNMYVHLRGHHPVDHRHVVKHKHDPLYVCDSPLYFGGLEAISKMPGNNIYSGESHCRSTGRGAVRCHARLGHKTE